MMTAEQGKPLPKPRRSRLRGVVHRVVRRGSKRLYGDVIPGHQPDKRIFVLRQPVGVVAAITPGTSPRR